MASSVKKFGVVLMSMVALTLLGCDNGPPSEAGEAVNDPALVAEDGNEAAAAENDAAIITSSLVAATAGGALSLASTGLSGDTLGTAGLGDGVKAVYFPRGCVSVQSDDVAKTVSYAFDGCAGPNGIFRLTGTVVATYEATRDKLTLQLVATRLQINRAVVDWAARAEITSDGPARTMHWHGTLSGTTGRGHEFSRTNDRTLSWRFGERCLAVSGVAEGTVRGRFLRTEIADFRRCQGSCPEAGARITITNADAKVKVEILFDGSNRATYSTPNGTKTIELSCKS